jgi:hypothetical protein
MHAEAISLLGHAMELSLEELGIPWQEHAEINEVILGICKRLKKWLLGQDSNPQIIRRAL